MLKDPNRAGSLAAVWDRRDFVLSLVIRNLKAKYQHSTFGFFWTLLNPLVTAVVLISVFTYVIRIKIEDYWAFLISGYFVWNFMQHSLNAGTYTLGEHASLKRSIAFPGEVLLIGATISRAIEFTIELSLVLIIIAVFRHGTVPLSYVLIPVLLLLQIALCIGLQCPIATLSVFFVDVQHALPLALLTLFYVSPVIYPVTLVPEQFQWVFFLNPIAQILTLYHAVIYEGVFPSTGQLGLATGVSFGILIAGYGIFTYYKRFIAEVL